MSEGDFNKQLNEQLIRNQGALREQGAAAERREREARAQVSELEEQLRDMTFHFESQIKILQDGGGKGELEGGQLELVKTPGSGGSGKRKAKGSRS